MSGRQKTGRLRVRAYAERPACGSGHPWRAETTRWRKVQRRGRLVLVRDCLVCKRESENRRRAERRAEARRAGVA